MMKQDIAVFDGDKEVYYSGDFNTYDNRLTLRHVEGYEVTFLFKSDPETKEMPIYVKKDDKQKNKINIELVNFNKTLGAGTTQRIPFLKLEDGTNLSFSIHVKALNDRTQFLKISVTLYREL